ncbi:MAG: acyl-CoA dehydrogenase family protein [Actinobacteria bacterium]|nr:acyl-CoA dehydrogenase family protein [Actinomycetota bacterium]
MEFAFSEEQRLFEGVLRDLLVEECPPEAVREAAAGPGVDRGRWNRLGSIGLLGITVDDRHPGGHGGTEVDAVLGLEAAGYVCLPEPVGEAYVVAALLKGTDLEQEWLPKIAAGHAVATIGPRSAVAHGDDAALLLLDDGEFTEVSTDALVEPRAGLDPTRGLVEVISGRGAALPKPWSEALDRAAFASAAHLIGVSRRVIEMAAGYSRDRHQFGKPIGSFQAIKHLLADAHLSVEFAAPVVYRAAWSLATDDANASRACSMAKAMASDAAVAACRAALQVHGAIGYTEEHDLHLWLKRGFAVASAWGDANHHRARIRASLLRR